MGPVTLTGGKTITPRYVTHEHKEARFVANAAYMAEREIVSMRFRRPERTKSSQF
jgi:hypothetical protein